MNTIKDNFDNDDSLLIDNLYNKKGISDFGDALNIMNQVGKENVFKGIASSIEAEERFKEKIFRAAKLFEDAFEFNPKEIAYYDNAANSYMKFGNKKAIEILVRALELIETTGKTEYLLSILY